MVVKLPDEIKELCARSLARAAALEQEAAQLRKDVETFKAAGLRMLGSAGTTVRDRIMECAAALADSGDKTFTSGQLRKNLDEDDVALLEASGHAWAELIDSLVSEGRLKKVERRRGRHGSLLALGEL